MCRGLCYLGREINIIDLLYHPNNSLIKQSYQPKLINLLNLAGFGMYAADMVTQPVSPLLYKTTNLPFYDENLYHLASSNKTECFLGHIRGVAYHEKQIITNQNIHPFVFNGTNIAFAHNGFLKDFNKMKYDLVKYIKPKYLECIRGTTDSEWIYALFLSELPNPTEIESVDNIIKGLQKTFNILQKIRIKNNLVFTSPLNLFITDGKWIAATRYALDYGWPYKDAESFAHQIYHSLWYTYGDSFGLIEDEYQMQESRETKSIIISSEPLTDNFKMWVEIPEYTLMLATKEEEKLKIMTEDITFLV